MFFSLLFVTSVSSEYPNDTSGKVKYWLNIFEDIMNEKMSMFSLLNRSIFTIQRSFEKDWNREKLFYTGIIKDENISRLLQNTYNWSFPIHGNKPLGFLLNENKTLVNLVESFGFNTSYRNSIYNLSDYFFKDNKQGVYTISQGFAINTSKMSTFLNRYYVDSQHIYIKEVLDLLDFNITAMYPRLNVLSNLILGSHEYLSRVLASVPVNESKSFIGFLGRVVDWLYTNPISLKELIILYREAHSQIPKFTKDLFACFANVIGSVMSPILKIFYSTNNGDLKERLDILIDSMNSTFPQYFNETTIHLKEFKAGKLRANDLLSDLVSPKFAFDLFETMIVIGDGRSIFKIIETATNGSTSKINQGLTKVFQFLSKPTTHISSFIEGLFLITNNSAINDKWINFTKGISQLRNDSSSLSHNPLLNMVFGNLDDIDSLPELADLLLSDNILNFTLNMSDPNHVKIQNMLSNISNAFSQEQDLSQFVSLAFNVDFNEYLDPIIIILTKTKELIVTLLEKMKDPFYSKFVKLQQRIESIMGIINQLTINPKSLIELFIENGGDLWDIFKEIIIEANRTNANPRAIYDSIPKTFLDINLTLNSISKLSVVSFPKLFESFKFESVKPQEVSIKSNSLSIFSLIPLDTLQNSINDIGTRNDNNNLTISYVSESIINLSTYSDTFIQLYENVTTDSINASVIIESLSGVNSDEFVSKFTTFAVAAQTNSLTPDIVSDFAHSAASALGIDLEPEETDDMMMMGLIFGAGLMGVLALGLLVIYLRFKNPKIQVEAKTPSSDSQLAP